MYKSKLIRVLKGVSKKEMTNFKLFLKSKTQKTADLLMSFYEILKDMHPHFKLKDKEITIEEVAKKLYRKAGEKETKSVKNLMVSMYKALEDFLIIKELEERPEERELLLLEAFKRRKLDKDFFDNVTKVQNKWTKDSLPGLEHFYQEYRLKKMCFLHPNHTLIVEKKMLVTVMDLINQLNKYHCANKLYWEFCYLFTENSISLSDDNYKNFRQNIDLNIDESLLEIPKVRFLHQLVTALFKEDFTNSTKIKADFLALFDSFSYEEKIDISSFLGYVFFENAQSKKANSIERKEALAELFELFRLRIENNFILDNERLSIGDYLNIIQTACAVDELTWAFNFANNYHIYIIENEQEDAFGIADAIIDLNKKEFKSALEKLVCVNFPSWIYGVYTKLTELKCYYELNEYEELDRLLHGFVPYLNNQSLGKRLIERYNNFITAIKELKKLKEQKIRLIEQKKYQDRKKALITFINSTNNISYLDWLDKKLEEL